MICSVALLIASIAQLSSAQFAIRQAFGAGSVVLDEYQAMSWGPLNLPARVTLKNFVMTGSSNWVNRTAAFDAYLFTKSFYESTYAAGMSVAVAPIEGWLTARAVTNLTNVLELVIPATATGTGGGSQVYFTLDNRPLGGRAPEAGSTVTISWDDFQWQTGAAVNGIAYPPGCGQHTVNTGPNQYLASAALVQTGVGYTAYASTVSTTGNAQFSAFIFDQTNLKSFSESGAWSLNSTNGVQCTNAVRCTVGGGSGPWYFVLGATGSGSVTYQYRLNEEASQSNCNLGSSTAATTTAAPGTTTTPAPGITTTTTVTTGSTATPTTTGTSTTTGTTPPIAATSTTTTTSLASTTTTAPDTQSQTPTTSNDDGSTASHSTTSGASDSTTGGASDSDTTSDASSTSDLESTVGADSASAAAMAPFCVALALLTARI